MLDFLSLYKICVVNRATLSAVSSGTCVIFSIKFENKAEHWADWELREKLSVLS